MSKEEPPKPDKIWIRLIQQMLNLVADHQAGRKAFAGPALKQSIREVCEEAKADGVPVERVIVELKQQCYAMPAGATHEKAETVTRLVTMCIHEYYVAPE